MLQRTGSFAQLTLITADSTEPCLMRIHPMPLVIGDYEGFSTDKDLFGRAKLGRGLTNLVSNIKQPLVIALDGQWGTGKTTFLKMWAGELRKAGFPVVYLDAFENDYIEDAFAVLVRQILTLSEESETVSQTVVDVFRKHSLDLGKQLLKSGLKIGASAGVKIITAGAFDGRDLDTLKEAISEGTAEAADNYLGDLFSKPNEQKDAAIAFREALQDLPAKLAPTPDDGTQKPLIYIIDELDRCKPVFALELLERIKHFLSVENVHFVFGVHMNQLEQSVRFAYGSDVDASNYLQKFVNLKVLNVDESDQRNETNTAKYIGHLQQSLEIPQTRNVQLAMEFIGRVAQEHNYSFRTLEHIFSSLAIASAAGDIPDGVIGPILGGLCILKATKTDLFSKAKTNQLHYEDIEEYFGFVAPQFENDSDHNNWEMNWWKVCLLDEVPDELSKLAQSEVFFRIGRTSYLTRISSDIIDRFEF
jgi:hypothetical protein